MAHTRNQGEPEHAESAWVSMTDVFLVVAMLFLGWAMQLNAEVDRGRTELQTLFADLELRTAQAEAIAKEASAAQSKVTELEQEAAPLRERAAAATSLAEQVAKLGLQLDGAGTGAAQLAGLQRILANAEAEARTARDLTTRAERELEIQRSALARAEGEVAREHAAVLELTTELAKSKDAGAMALRNNTATIQKAAELSKRLDEYDRAQGTIRQDLLGIKGKLDRVVFVFDCSSSMKRGNRWEDGLQTMRSWLELLPVRNAAAIVFNDDVTALPEPPQLLSMAKKENRDVLMGMLAAQKAEGETNTSAALKRAYEYEPIDAIILFTDGRPNEPSATKSLVTEMALKYPHTRVHTVGLGDYFDSDFGKLLLEISRLTGGTFVGK